MFSKKNKSDFKAKLEHKLYLARENPESTFDISDCGLRQVPSGVYSLCKVFLKESLLLNQNKLSSLSSGGSLKDLSGLKLLNIQHNVFTSLPDDIALLSNLRELYLNYNNIKHLPTGIGSLINLKIVDVSFNELKDLPSEIGKLTKLQQLKANGNKNLKKLPVTLCCASQLSCLLLDADKFIYPPVEVVEEGTESIMKYLCKDFGIPYNPSVDVHTIDEVYSPVSAVDDTDANLQEKIWEYKKLKEQRQKEILLFEKEFEKYQQQELELQAANKANRLKILTDITQQQTKLECDIARIHSLKEVEKQKFIKEIQEEEVKIDKTIQQLLAINKEPLLQLLEQEKLEEERLLTITCRHNDTLRRNDVLKAMQALLEEETSRFKQYDQNREETARSILSQEMLSDSHVADVLKNQGLQQAELVHKLQQDMELQRVAVGALLERGDARSWGLVQQVHLVETQLAKLTAIEMDKRKLELDEHLNELTAKRANLSVLLVELLEQQGIRRAQLMCTLEIMQRNGYNSEDFWLLQYQRLLDRQPECTRDTQKYIDPEFAQELLLAGVIHYLPFLAKWAQTAESEDDLCDEQLLEAGVKKKEHRELILQAFHNYKKLSRDIKNVPSAPDICNINAGPSAPAAVTESSTLTTECVICMDAECEMIFVPCGHLCCCTKCASAVTECPLCRLHIDRKIKVMTP